jgi:hypothetical protein
VYGVGWSARAGAEGAARAQRKRQRLGRHRRIGWSSVWVASGSRLQPSPPGSGSVAGASRRETRIAGPCAVEVTRSSRKGT